MRNLVVGFTLCFDSFVSSHFAIAAGADFGLQKYGNEAEKGVSVEAELSTETALNRTEVDGDKAERTQYKSTTAALESIDGRLSFGFSLTGLSRDSEDYKTFKDSEKTTLLFTPNVSFALGKGYEGFATYSVIKTKVEQSYLPDASYDLNTSRASFGIAKNIDQGKVTLSYANEARAEKDYLMMGEYPAVDREYIPAQVELSYRQKLGAAFGVLASVRYSHYNNDVYKEQYDSDVPTSPTIGQVFDYLLSLKAGASYAFSKNFEVTGSLLRKAALDVNSYTGDEYVVSYDAALDFITNVGKDVSFGIGSVQSTGKKDHEVLSQTYNYASKRESYHGFAQIRM